MMGNNGGKERYTRGTVKQRILHHLSQFSYVMYDYDFPYSTVPRDISQKGIAEAVGITRAHASLELIVLKEEGVVGETLAHVEGAHRKIKVYYMK